MRLFAPLPVLIAVAGVSAQDKTCKANYIVDRCLSTETNKAAACGSAEWDCLCAAYEAVATCYNNCPNDPRALDAQGNVSIYCVQASLYNTKTKSTTTSSTATSASTPTITDDVDAANTGSATTSSDSADETGAAADLAVDDSRSILALMGIIAAFL